LAALARPRDNRDTRCSSGSGRLGKEAHTSDGTNTPGRHARILTIRKGHWVTFILGIFVQVFWIIGAVMRPRR